MVGRNLSWILPTTENTRSTGAWSHGNTRRTWISCARWPNCFVPPGVLCSIMDSHRSSGLASLVNAGKATAALNLRHSSRPLSNSSSAAPSRRRSQSLSTCRSWKSPRLFGSRMTTETYFLAYPRLPHSWYGHCRRSDLWQPYRRILRYLTRNVQQLCQYQAQHHQPGFWVIEYQLQYVTID